MIDLWHAVFGPCPWCVRVKESGWLDRVPRPLALLWLRIDGLKVWRLGLAWHEHHHATTY